MVLEFPFKWAQHEVWNGVHARDHCTIYTVVERAGGEQEKIAKT